ncbi:multimerin-2-like [Haliotis rubra]|uniref:multimerin-2-like n=1 Tax=Haliotis rubra TaxID=36100 RepID=UPI001EE53D65|nr:multimerin-2-like [Haliotis rubra]
MPLTKSDGTVNLTTILSHITLLEQTVDTLHKDTSRLQIDLRTTNETLQLTQADLNITKQELQTSRTELQVTQTDLNITKQELQTSRTELQATKVDLQHTQTDLQTIKKDLQAAQTDLMTNKGLQQSAAAEILSLKNNMTILRTELGIVKSKVENTGLDFHPLSSTSNDSLLVSLNGSFTANQDVIRAIVLDVQSVHSDLNTTAHTLSEVQADINSFKRNISSALRNVTAECTALKSDSHLFSSLQSDITAMDKKLSFLNITVREVQSEARQVAANTSSVIQLIAHRQSLKTLAQDTWAQLKQCEKNVNSTDASMTAQLNRLEMDMNCTSVYIHNVQQNLLSLESDLNTTREDITMTNSDVHALNKTLASKTRAVAFQAYASKSRNVTSQHPVVYDSTIYNIGSGYNHTTGNFTAPVSGTYMFWTELRINSYAYTPHMTIKQSGRSIGSGWSASTSTDDESVISATCVSHLQKGEAVWVEFEKFAWWATAVSVVPGGFDTRPKSFFGGALLTVD